MITMLLVKPPDVYFDSKCPVCRGIMADGNLYCCMGCYRFANGKEEKKAE